MITKNRIRGALYFLAGAAVTVAVMLSLGSTQEAEAGDPYACIRQGLAARGMSGNIPAPYFKVTYSIPSCFKSAGYKVSKVYMYGGEVTVAYTK